MPGPFLLVKSDIRVVDRLPVALNLSFKHIKINTSVRTRCRRFFLPRLLHLLHRIIHSAEEGVAGKQNILFTIEVFDAKNC